MATPRDSWSRVQSLLVELRQRRIYRVSALYAAAAFVAWQLAEIAVPALHLPDWVLTLVVAGSIAGLPLVVVLAWIFDVTPAGVRRAEPAAPGLLPGPRRLAVAAIVLSLFGVSAYFGIGTYRSWAGQLPPIRSLAVLPLENLSEDPEQAYFAGGLTEALITELAQINGLKVTSRTSSMQYLGARRGMPDIARELGVEGVVEGAVLQVGDEVRISLQLIHGPTDRHLWSQNYQRPLRDILALQADVAGEIARAIRLIVAIEEEAPRQARTVDPTAYRMVLKGDFHQSTVSERSFDRAVHAYSEAVRRDPTYAPAHAGLASAYVQLASWHSSAAPGPLVEKAEAAANRALALDSTLAEAHIARARIRQLFDWDWRAADLAYRRGIELAPSATHARVLYANFLWAMGRFDEGIRIASSAVERDPLTPVGWVELGWILLHAGRWDEALSAYHRALELDPALPVSHQMAGDAEGALHYLDGLEPDLADLPPSYGGWAGMVYAHLGKQQRARELLTVVEEHRASTYVPASVLADVHVALGNRDAALHWLEVAFAERDPSLVSLRVVHRYRPLHSDPRFQAIVRKLQFPDS
jgi:TolB-like protein